MAICGRCNTEFEGLECPECKKERTPYYKKRLADNKNEGLSKRYQFTTELNREEQELLDKLKVLWDFKSDSKVMKLCLEWVGNAIFHNKMGWSEDTWRYVLSVERQRLSNFKKLPNPTLKENARDS